MNWYRKNWYFVGGVLFVIMAYIVGIFGEAIDPIRRLNILLFMSLVLHEFEEYVLPGGFGVALNLGMFGEQALADRYPGNTNNCLIVNVFCVYPLYLLAILLPQWHVLGLLLAYFGMTQIMVHGFIINKKLHTFYNPGLATTVFIFIPLGIYYIYYTAAHFLLPTWQWVASVIALPIMGMLTVMLPIQLGKDKNTRYVFQKRDIGHFAVKNAMAYNHKWSSEEEQRYEQVLPIPRTGQQQ